MELAVRKDSDRFVKQSAYGALQARLRRQSGKLAEIPTVVLSAFDRSTRLLPFLFYDTLMFPAGAGAIPICYARARSSNCAGICTGTDREIVQANPSLPVKVDEPGRARTPQVAGGRDQLINAADWRSVLSGRGCQLSGNSGQTCSRGFDRIGGE